MAFQGERARALLLSAGPRARATGAPRPEIRATVHGGAMILDKIDAAGGDVFRHRPVLGTWDWARILTRAVAR